jgi:TPR repeat protein
MTFDVFDGEDALRHGAYRHAFKVFLGLCQNLEDPAFYRVCQMELDGHLTPEERDEMVAVLTAQTKKGNLDAAFNLAVLFSRSSTMIDLPRAEALFKVGTGAGMGQAGIALAKLYMGDGSHLLNATSDNIMKALQDAFASGIIEAAWLIARQHMTGQHARKDDFEAFRWLFIAGRLGHEEARKHALMLEGLRPGAYQWVGDEALDLLDKMQNRGVKFV